MNDESLYFYVFYLAFLVFHVCKFSYYKKTSKTTTTTTTTPLTKQYFRLELIGLNLTDITWPENSKFLHSFGAFFAKFNSAYSSVVFRTILGRNSLPVIQFSLMLLGWGIWTPSMLNLLCFAFKISFSRYSWLGLIGKSNFCANITFSIKFALRALLPIGTPRWRRYFPRSSTFHFCYSSSVKYIVKELKEYITALQHCNIY